ncbi:MAG: hypothetical protein KatS3mg109_0159 [Pirellulaceae bacterium]|nr:MAG: hypothetical protein KatS3mg109_0159 [Pirellulaceae bacterium]
MRKKMAKKTSARAETVADEIRSVTSENPNLTVREIAEKTGASRRYIYIVCNKERLSYCRMPRPTDPDYETRGLRMAVVRLIEENPKWSPASVAQKLGCSREYVYSVIRGEGLNKYSKTLEKKVLRYAKREPTATVGQIIEAVGGNYRQVRAILRSNGLRARMSIPRVGECGACGKLVVATRKYCSLKCYAVDQRGSPRYYSRTSRGKSGTIVSRHKTVTLICNGCGVTFERSESVHNSVVRTREAYEGRKLRPSQLAYYCSRDCFHKNAPHRKSKNVAGKRQRRTGNRAKSACT